MTEIKAIETKYKGYRFRSRTEARWAVFFDAAGVKWDYEKEGFTLGNGESYLPDFWLPTLNAFAEVKGQAFTPREIERCRQLSKYTKRDVIMLDGQPELRSYPSYTESGEAMSQRVLYAAEHIGRDAVEAALSARFEHGESGAPVQRQETLDRVPRGPRRNMGHDAERELVRIMLVHRSRIEVIAERVGPASFQDPLLRSIFAALLESAEEAVLPDDLDPDALTLASKLMAEDASGIDVQRTIDDSVVRLRVREMEQRLTELERLLAVATADEKVRVEEEKSRLILEMRQSGKGSFRAFRRGRR